MAKAEIEGGVIATPVPITAGGSVHIMYNGLLSDSGADQVFMHVGYGMADQWNMVEDQVMERTKWGWEVLCNVHGDQRFNFCFKDSAANWDNNNGRNWSYEIHNGQRY
ncbi:MAG: carbohydrate-binding protein [Solirubrobacterales bacterium]